MADLVRGARILVTGATSGVGEALVHRLAQRGASVLVHGRDAARVRSVTDAARAELASGGEPPQAFVADLTALAQVVELARAVAQGGRLDVLINNAGVGFGKDRKQREQSADGFELRFAVNYLAPFLLTELLGEVGLPSRAVVNVASAGQAPLDHGDLMSERGYEGTLAYRRSKLALIADTFQRAARHPERAYVALHPGTFLATKMVLEAGITPQGSAESGAAAVLSVLERALGGETGRYFDCATPASADPSASDPQEQAFLRAESLELVAPFLG
jgi:NAD(P)-dependent dehydrogenase (short-subunit alcohol dehydrogenase family)